MTIDFWAVLEWECCLKDPEQVRPKARPFIRDHIIKVTEKSFDDFAGAGTDDGSQPAHARNSTEDDAWPLKARASSAAPRMRLGMVGGGRARSSARVHRLAARMDDQYVFVAGALSSEPERARAIRRGARPRPDRIYTDFREMAQPEASAAGRHRGRRRSSRPTICISRPPWPSSRRHPCDLRQAADVTSQEAKKLATLVEQSGAFFALTHNYTGYPMVRQAREMVAAGELGEIRVVQVEYPQDWLTEPIEQTGQKQAAWRTDPKQTGAGGCIGDIGTHAYQARGSSCRA